MTTDPIIDPSCLFGSALTQGEIKSLIQSMPQFIIENGMVCSNAETDSLDNTLLGNYFTGLWAQTFRALSTLHQNNDFAQCMWDTFYCDLSADQFFFGSALGTDSASINLPTGGSWDYLVVSTGRNGDGSLENTTGSRHFFFDTGSDEDILNGNFTGNRAGGLPITVNQAGFDQIMISVFAKQEC